MVGKLYIIPDCKVEHLITSKDSTTGHPFVTGVQATATIFSDQDGKRISIQQHAFHVNAKVVVCSAGSLHTPAILKRSGFYNPLIGAHLTLHPVLAAGGVFPKDVNTGLASGVSMGVVVREPKFCANGDESHAVAIETPPVHTGMMGATLPWRSGLSFKVRLNQQRYRFIMR